jgi:chromosome segregation ATPase
MDVCRLTLGALTRWENAVSDLFLRVLGWRRIWDQVHSEIAEGHRERDRLRQDLDRLNEEQRQQDSRLDRLSLRVEAIDRSRWARPAGHAVRGAQIGTRKG